MQTSFSNPTRSSLERSLLIQILLDTFLPSKNILQKNRNKNAWKQLHKANTAKRKQHSLCTSTLYCVTPFWPIVVRTRPKFNNLFWCVLKKLSLLAKMQNKNARINCQVKIAGNLYLTPASPDRQPRVVFR